MGFRFRKRLKIAPGIHVNLGKRGASMSVGRRGASLTVGGKRGTRATVGIPGTGISHTTNLSHRSNNEAGSDSRKGVSFLGLIGYGLLVLLLILFVLLISR